MTEFIRLNEQNCRDCYKCIRNCLIKAIRYSDGRAQIIPDECIQCGECLVTCPRHGRVEHGSADAIRRQIRSGRRVVMSASPAFIADFDVGSIEDLRETLATRPEHEAITRSVRALVAQQAQETMVLSTEACALMV